MDTRTTTAVQRVFTNIVEVETTAHLQRTLLVAQTNLSAIMARTARGSIAAAHQRIQLIRDEISSRKAVA